MSKTKKRFNEYDDEQEGGFITNHSEHLKEKRLQSAIKTKNIDDLLKLEDELEDYEYYDYENDDNSDDWEEYKRKNGL
jgi:hypothetical protein